MPRHDVLGADGEEGVVDREAGQQIARRGDGDGWRGWKKMSLTAS